MKARFIPQVALLVLAIVAPAGVTNGKGPSASQVREQFEFEIRDFKVSHQGGNVLTLKVRYDYRAGLRAANYPDFRELAKACEEFLRTYPNNTDFWEILNLKLTARLLRDFPALASITIEIRVAADDHDPYFRASTVTRTR